MLGIEPPEDGPSRRADDPQRMRETLFSAIRSLVEAMTGEAPAGARVRGHPLGRRGDARPDRAPRALGAGAAADRLPRPRRAARPPRRLGRGPPQRDLDLARAAHPGRDQGARAGALRRWGNARQRRRRRARLPRRRAGRRQPAVRGGDRQPPAGGGRRGGDAARAPSMRCSRPGSTRCRSFERRLLQYASVVGQNFWDGVAAPRLRGRERRRRLRPRLAAGEGAGDRRRLQPAGRGARVRVQARPDPRRRLRDAAEGEPAAASTSRSASFIEERVGERRRGRGRAGRRALRPRRDARRRGGDRAGRSCGG